MGFMLRLLYVIADGDSTLVAEKRHGDFNIFEESFILLNFKVTFYAPTILNSQSSGLWTPVLEL